jgi:O-antigen/teichoic acid export membrane protein
MRSSIPVREGSSHLPAGSAWHRAGEKFVGLAAARVAAQGLAFAWFLLAARRLPDTEFGTLATGLAAMTVLAGVGDLGTTRTIVRHVAPDPRRLWSTYRRALGLRVLGGAFFGSVATALGVLLSSRIDPEVIALAALTATVSGVSELGYAALRSVGRVGPEMATLVAERAVFLAIAWPVLERGGGPVAVFVVYVLTNAATALATGAIVRIRQPAEREPAGRVADAEARRVAVGFAVAALGPRVPVLLLAVVAGAAPAGTFSVAQRPVEAVTLLAVASMAPLYPMVRAHVARGRSAAGIEVARVVLAAGFTVLAPLVAWWLLAPATFLRLVVGSGRYAGADTVLRILALTGFTWLLRSTGELVLLAEERARSALAVAGGGLAVLLGVGVPLAREHGSVGAGVAVLVSDLVAASALVALSPGVRPRVANQALPAALVVATGATLALVRDSEALVLSVVGAWLAVATVIGARMLTRLGQAATS